MITIVKSEGNHTSLGSFEATIVLKDTVAAKYAPYGTASDSPHCKGWGNSPELALKDAHRRLGEYITTIPIT